MAWLAVNRRFSKTGDELPPYEVLFIRGCPEKITEIWRQKGTVTWYDGTWGRLLSTGTIEKLTGKKMTYKNSPLYYETTETK